MIVPVMQIPIGPVVEKLNELNNFRILGSVSICLDRNPPKVRVSLHSEKEDLKEAISGQVSEGVFIPSFGVATTR